MVAITTLINPPLPMAAGEDDDRAGEGSSRRFAEADEHRDDDECGEGADRGRASGSHRPNGILTAVRLRLSAIIKPSKVLAPLAVALLAVLLLTRTTASASVSAGAADVTPIVTPGSVTGWDRLAQGVRNSMALAVHPSGTIVEVNGMVLRLTRTS